MTNHKYVAQRKRAKFLKRREKKAAEAAHKLLEMRTVKAWVKILGPDDGGDYPEKTVYRYYDPAVKRMRNTEHLPNHALDKLSDRQVHNLRRVAQKHSP